LAFRRRDVTDPERAAILPIRPSALRPSAVALRVIADRLLAFFILTCAS